MNNSEPETSARVTCSGGGFFMQDGVRRFIADCASSSVGRLVFVAYAVYLVSLIGYAYDHIPGAAYPFRFYGERELFELMNLPQLELIRSLRLIFRWQASRFTDALAAIYIALPWWVYGHLIERIAKRVMDRGDPAAAERTYSTFCYEEPQRGLQTDEFFEWIAIPRRENGRSENAR